MFNSVFFLLINLFFWGYLLYNIVLVLSYIDMIPPRMYMCSPSWTPLPPPSPSHPSGSCSTLWNPMDCSPPGSSVHGILQARILEWVAISSSRGSSWPKDQTQVSWCLLCWQADSLPLSHLGSSMCLVSLGDTVDWWSRMPLHLPS